MFTSTQNPTLLECILSEERKSRSLYAVLKSFRYKIFLTRNREGFDIVPLSLEEQIRRAQKESGPV